MVSWNRPVFSTATPSALPIESSRGNCAWAKFFLVRLQTARMPATLSFAMIGTQAADVIFSPLNFPA